MQKAFSLIEILIVIAIASFILFFSQSLDLSSIEHTNLSAERDNILTLLFQARSKAMNSTQNSNFGFCLKDGSYLVFQGSTCGQLIETTIKSNTDISQHSQTHIPDQIIFSKITGLTEPATIILDNGEKFLKISINNEGTINW